ncbi:aminotransferase class V-fold PLP-dependent enzyme [Candidatus Bathyarchaeota archaeon]|nr:aminotransferase class V-fold PLP-dependent enzyme [Candidatus Bathyarchaeota archaeon]
MVKPKDITMPENGTSKEELTSIMSRFHEGDANWEQGKTWTYVYNAGSDFTNFIKQAHNRFFMESGLSPMAFPSLKRFEAEVVSMAVDMLRGNKRCFGNMTTGGTESILMATKTYRDWARDKKPAINEPEMIVPESAHPAFEKAAHYFDMNIIRTPLDGNFKADVKAVERAITENTVMIVGSAIDYPTGIVDPIEDLAALAKEHGIGFHTDSCLGGFMLPFVRKLHEEGEDVPRVPDFDFKVPGVTSISADLHKYGYAPKGTSLILYKNQKWWKYQFFAHVEWSGGAYASPTMTGTRSGALMAAAWTIMKFLGWKGYMTLARNTMHAARELQRGIEEIPELSIRGDPVMSVFGCVSNDEKINPYILADQLGKKGWTIDCVDAPQSMHFIVCDHHYQKQIVPLFLEELKETIDDLKDNPVDVADGAAAVYGMISSLPDRDTAKDTVIKFMMDQYKT